MDFEREDSPPPAYSESDYDKKLSSAIQFLEISEETEEEEWNEGRSEGVLSSGARELAPPVKSPSSHIPQPASAKISNRGVRRLPVPPRDAVANNDKPTRVHRKSVSHSYTLSPAPKSRPKWHGDAEGSSNPRSPSRSLRGDVPLEHRSHSPTAWVPTYSSPHRSGPKNDRAFSQSPPTSPLTQSFSSQTASHTRAVSVSQLNFDASVAYSQSNFSPFSAGSTRSEPSHHHPPHTFNPNSLYNSAVSSHLHVSSSVPSHLNNTYDHSSRSALPQNSSVPFTAARPSQTTWTPPVSSSPRRPQSPSYISHSTGATQFPLHPSRITNPTQNAHDRWATSEHQFVHT
ncbi:hypothetical protein EV359DRAFT_76532 [Lentinula novae-zelandiae]|nr:hypothetical protein EV359DRAFT_76532 [Lentinula novae-zelandiae]